MDVGYVVAAQGNNEELRYSLRSLCNLEHDRVFVAGHIPSWLRNVAKLPRPSTSRRKFIGAGLNLLTLCESDISDDFIFFNDDFFIMKPTSLPMYHRGKLAYVYRSLSRTGMNEYLRGMEATRVFLQENYGIEDPISYELHVPMVVNKDVMRTILLATNISTPIGRPNYHLRTIYGNVARVGGERMRDVKVSATSDHDLLHGRAKFLSTSDRSFAGGRAGRFIRATFPDPSPYEQQSSARRR